METVPFSTSCSSKYMAQFILPTSFLWICRYDTIISLSALVFGAGLLLEVLAIWSEGVIGGVGECKRGGVESVRALDG